MPSPTIYAFRQVLTLALRQLVAATWLPAVNADLSAQMTAQACAPATIPAFADADLVMGDRSPVRTATLCLVPGAEENRKIGSEGLFYLTLTTKLRLKTPRVGDNAPEDFDLLSSVCTDTMRDLLTSSANATITPRNPAGQLLLPAGLSFQDCHYLGAQNMSFPMREIDGVTYTRGVEMVHSAGIAYFQNRSGALGGS